MALGFTTIGGGPIGELDFVLSSIVTFPEALLSIGSPFIELWELDLTTIPGGSTIYHFTTMTDADDLTQVEYNGISYAPFPIQATGFTSSGDGSAPPQPTLTVSNVNMVLLGAMLGHDDLVGAKVTRTRTFKRFLDGQANADVNAHFAPDVYLVNQKTSHNKTQISWSLISMIDRPNLMLPRRQILRDPTSKNLYAPGVAQTRTR